MRRTSFCALRTHHVQPCYKKSLLTVHRNSFTTNANKQHNQSANTAQKVTTSESAQSIPEAPKAAQTAKKLKKVLVSGAGLAGLTCAKTLQKKGIEVVVVDSEGTDYSNNGIIVHFPAQYILEKLGVYSQVQAKGSSIAVSAFGNDSGGTYGYVEYGKILPSLHHDTLSIDTPSLLQILSQGVNVKRKTPVKSIEQTDNGISVRTRNSVTAEHYDLVIAADDVESKVRTSLFDPESINISRPGYLLWEVIMDRPDSVFPAHNIECWGLKAHLGFLPLGNDKLYVWGCFHPKVPLQLLPDVQHRDLKEASEFYSHFEGFGVPAVLRELTSGKHKCTITFPARVNASSWVKGNAVIIGDAAHAYPPTNTYGPLMAIEDGYVLGSMLAAVQDMSQLQSTLQQFQNLRKSRIAAATKHTERSDVLLAQKKKPLSNFFNNRALSWTCSSQMLKQRMTKIVNFNPEPTKV